MSIYPDMLEAIYLLLHRQKMVTKVVQDIRAVYPVVLSEYNKTKHLLATVRHCDEVQVQLEKSFINQIESLRVLETLIAELYFRTMQQSSPLPLGGSTCSTRCLPLICLSLCILFFSSFSRA